MVIRDRVKELRRVRAGDLLPNPQNWRQHPKAQQDALRGILAQVGYADALLVRETQYGLMLIDGHLRAETTPDQEVPVLVLDVDADEADLLLASIDPLAAMATTDQGKLAALMSGLKVESEALLAMLTANNRRPLELQEGLTEPNAVPEVVETRCQPGDLWLLGDHRLVCGDSTVPTDVERLFGPARAEMVWTDPPYGVAVGNKNKMLNALVATPGEYGRSNRVTTNLVNDELSEPALQDMLQGSFGLAAGVCTAGAAWYVAAPPGPLHVLFGQVLKAMGIWHQTIQWVKNNATFSPMGVDYHWQAEPIFYGWLPNAAHRFRGDRKQTTVWEIDRPQKSPEHPTMKPVLLVVRAVENSSDPGDIVYDPFMGSGTTIIAAQQTGRRAYGLEIDPHYCDVIIKRWEDFTGETATIGSH